MEWEMSKTDLMYYRRWLGATPKDITKASALMLNDFAREMKDEAFASIRKSMTVRNPGFVMARLRYTKTTYTTPINQQKSIMGSVADKPRFTGWDEQEYGSPVVHKRVATIAGRSGSFANQIRPMYRLKPGAKVCTLSKLDPKGTNHNGGFNVGGAVAMLQRIGWTGLILWNRRFYVLPRAKTSGFTGPGYVQGKDGKRRVSTGLVRSMLYVQKQEKHQPKRNPWLNNARAVYFAKTNLDEKWSAKVKQCIRPPKRA